MSTRSMIAKQIADDEYLGIYCHSDGSLTHNGALLLDCYNTPEKVDELIALGDLSYLGKHLMAEPQKQYKSVYQKIADNITIAYARDTGEELKAAGIFTLEQLCNKTPVTYVYIFNLNNEWKYNRKVNSTELSDVKTDLAAEYALYGLKRPQGYYGNLNQEIANELSGEQDCMENGSPVLSV